MDDEKPTEETSFVFTNPLLVGFEDYEERQRLHFKAKALAKSSIENRQLHEKPSYGGLFSLGKQMPDLAFKKRLFEFCERRPWFSFHPYEDWENRALKTAALEHIELKEGKRGRGQPRKVRGGLLGPPMIPHQELYDEIQNNMNAGEYSQTLAIEYYICCNYPKQVPGTEAYNVLFRKIEKYVSSARAKIGKPLKRGRKPRRITEKK